MTDSSPASPSGAAPLSRTVDSRMVLWMALLSGLWGLNAITIKTVAMEMPPILAVAARGAVALALMTGYGLWRRQLGVFRGWLVVHGLVAGLLFGLEFWLFYAGARFTTGGHMAIFINTAPFFVAIGAHLLFPDDRLFLVRWIGLVLAFAGVVAIFSDDLVIQKTGVWRGDLLVMLGSLAWALTTLYIKRFMVQALTGFQMLYAQILVSTPFLFLVSSASEQSGMDAFTPLGLAIIVFQAVVIVFFSYMAWMALLRVYPASAVQSFTFLTPVWGVLLGAAILSEVLTLMSLAGMALVGLGLVLVNRSRAQET